MGGGRGYKVEQTTIHEREICLKNSNYFFQSLLNIAFCSLLHLYSLEKKKKLTFLITVIDGNNSEMKGSEETA